MRFKLYRRCYQKIAKGDSRKLWHIKNFLISTILALPRAYIDQTYILEQYDYKPAQVKSKKQMKGQDSEHLRFCRINTLLKENALGDTNELYTIAVPEELGQKTGTGV